MPLTPCTMLLLISQILHIFCASLLAQFLLEKERRYARKAKAEQD